MATIFGPLGLNTPAQRFAAGAVVSGLALVSIKPEFAFEDGVPKPWSFVTDPENAVTEVTPVPWWLVSFGVGASLAVFF